MINMEKIVKRGPDREENMRRGNGNKGELQDGWVGTQAVGT